MKATLGNSSPWCHSTLATTHRDTFQLSRGLVSEIVIRDDSRLWGRPLSRPCQQVRYDGASVALRLLAA